MVERDAPEAARHLRDIMEGRPYLRTRLADGVMGRLWDRLTAIAGIGAILGFLGLSVLLLRHVRWAATPSPVWEFVLTAFAMAFLMAHLALRALRVRHHRWSTR
jgi:hypothetical protein